MVSTGPRLTVGMPVYNGEAFLKEALDSVRSQTFDEFEIIISDNASTDGTEEICREAEQADDRVRYTRAEENLGASWNFGEVLRLASGEYFKWATHDDVCSPTMFERCIAALDEDDIIILAYPHSDLIDTDGVQIQEYDDGLALMQDAPADRVMTFFERFGLANCIFGIHRRSALIRTGGLRPFTSSDVVLLVELALLGKFFEVPDLLFHRRSHPGMSVRANRTPRERLRWFETGARASFPLPRARLFVELCRVVAASSMSPADKARTMGVLTRRWGLKTAYHTLGDVKANIRDLRS